MDLPDQVFDAKHKNVLAKIVVSFTAVMHQRNPQAFLLSYLFWTPCYGVVTERLIGGV